MQKILRKIGIELIGGVDESQNTYKDINKVMANQQELTEVIGKFMPKIVIMDK